jgi:hypothetical protein
LSLVQVEVYLQFQQLLLDRPGPLDLLDLLALLDLLDPQDPWHTLLCPQIWHYRLPLPLLLLLLPHLSNLRK